VKIQCRAGKIKIEPKPLSLFNRLLFTVFAGLLMLGQPAAIVADWTPTESSVTPPTVVTLDAFAAPDLNGA